MAKDYVAQLIDETNKVLEETRKKKRELTVTMQDGSTRKPSATFYVMSANDWHHDLVKITSGLIFRDGLLKASNILESSIFLSVHGFYDSAIAELRDVLDDFLTRLYFDILAERGELEEYTDDSGRRSDKYCDWAYGKNDRYPSFKENVLKEIFQSKYFKKFNEKYRRNEFKQDIIKLYGELSKFTHNRPDLSQYGGYRVQSSLFNVRFNGEHFDNWINYLKEIYILISTIVILRCPQILDSNTNQVQNFKAIRPDIVKDLKELHMELSKMSDEIDRLIKELHECYNKCKTVCIIRSQLLYLVLKDKGLNPKRLRYYNSKNQDERVEIKLISGEKYESHVVILLDGYILDSNLSKKMLKREYDRKINEINKGVNVISEDYERGPSIDDLKAIQHRCNLSSVFTNVLKR